jgi:hypothetical protein
MTRDLLKRYSPKYHHNGLGGNYADMVHDVGGQFVKWSDAEEALTTCQQETARLREKVEALRRIQPSEMTNEAIWRANGEYIPLDDVLALLTPSPETGT